MCGCQSRPSYSAFLKPPQGSPLGLKEGETWIGRGDFEASMRAQLLCSRRQARFELTDTGLRLECHGCNPLLFVVCHSKNFYGSEATPANELFLLRKGEAVQLVDGDQFYYAAMECLLTVVIRQHDTVPVSRHAPEIPLQPASEVCVKDKEQSFIEYCLPDEQQVAEIPREHPGPTENCGTGDPQRSSLKDDSDMCMNSSKAVAALHCPEVAGPQEILTASKPLGSPAVDCQLLKKSKDESVQNDKEDSDSLGLDAYDCAPREGVSRFVVEQPLGCISPRPREETAEPTVFSENDNCLDEPSQICPERCIEEVVPNSTIDEVLQGAECPQLFSDIEGCRPACVIREDYQHIETSSRTKDVVDGLGCNEDLPSESCALSEQIEQRQTEDYNVIMSSETIDGRSFEDELLLSEQANRSAIANGVDCSSRRPKLDSDHNEGDILFKFPVGGSRDEVSERMEVEEHLEVADRVNEREGGPEASADVEDVSWPDGPVEGMEAVIASVSGYEGVDRQNLVKLINKTGAAFTGGLSKANTHLVCRSFHGKKFDHAMKLHKVVINHQWLEDCLRAGKRLSEDPYKLRSGEDVGPLKWIETPPPPVIERAQPSRGGINQHPNDPFFLNTVDHEGNMGLQGQNGMRATTSFRKDPLGTSRQAGLANVETGLSSGRKSRRLIKRSGLEVWIDPFIIEQENLDPASSSGRAEEPHQRRTVEEVYNTRRRKSANSALYGTGQAQRHDTKRRKPASSILMRSSDDQERGAASNLRENLRGEGRVQSSAGAGREFAVINLADDDNDDMREIGLPEHQAASAQATGGTNTASNRGRSSQCSQSSQRDREVACAICLVEAKSPSEGLLECGHKFCYKCIFTWTIQAVKGPSCPLCKAPFDFITRQDMSSLGKVDETVVVVGKTELGSSSRSLRTVVLDAVCIQCGNSDSESLLMRCGTCGNRAVHTFCMDPPAPPPWFCPGCTHGHHRDSMRLAWNQFLPGSSTAINADSNQEIRPVIRSSNVRRRNTQSYTFRRPSRPVSTYRPSLHTELTQSMGPARRRNVVGQHSLRTWLNNDAPVSD